MPQNNDKENSKLDQRIDKLVEESRKYITQPLHEKVLWTRAVVFVAILAIYVFGINYLRMEYCEARAGVVKDSLLAKNQDTLRQAMNQLKDYVARPYFYERIDPAVETNNIAQSSNIVADATNKTIEKTQEKKPKYIRKPLIVDINKADTTELKRIRGIGSKRAKGIVKFRELLGGYYCVEQLYEVYGMDSAVVQTNYRAFKCDTSDVHRISVNKIKPKDLYHPYLKGELLKAMRTKLYKGAKFNSFDDIKRMAEYDSTTNNQAIHYLTFE